VSNISEKRETSHIVHQVEIHVRQAANVDEVPICDIHDSEWGPYC
jgi:hypothetical protein